MKNAELAWVRISSRRFKKQLLISPSKLPLLQAALKAELKEEFLLINTNIGLDLYTLNEWVSPETLKLSYTQFAIEPHPVRLQIATNSCELEAHFAKAFNRLSIMPLLFKSYTAGLCTQLNTRFDQAPTLILALFDCWQRVLISLEKTTPFNPKTHLFLNHLQELYNQKNYHPLLKELIKNAVDLNRQN